MSDQRARITRTRLLDAAEAVFQAEGLAHASLERVARRAGMTRGAIYCHFRDKADLFRALLERVDPPLQALIREAHSAALTATPLASLATACRRGLAGLEAPHQRRVHRILLLRCEAFDGIDPPALMARRAERLFDALHGVFRAAQARGQLPADTAPDTLARLLQTLLLGLYHRWLGDATPASLSEEGMTMVETFLFLLGTPGAATHPAPRPEALSRRAHSDTPDIRRGITP
ncbi:TetR family transcriptional regulator [Halomonas sp. H5]|uniref:TetR family transcriptional regulator n=1 Tax=Halomonas sp. H5 TaxID=3423910 RepID=UPI003D36360F